MKAIFEPKLNRRIYLQLVNLCEHSLKSSQKLKHIELEQHEFDELNSLRNQDSHINKNFKDSEIPNSIIYHYEIETDDGFSCSYTYKDILLICKPSNKQNEIESI